eukprot:gene9149-10122_t
MPSKTLAVLDLETTGLSSKADRIIQLACLISEIKDSSCKPKRIYDAYFNPGEDGLMQIYKSGAERINRISPEMLRNQPSFRQKADEILNMLKDVDILVGHNVIFDYDMLVAEFARLDDADNQALPPGNMSTSHQEERLSWKRKFQTQKFVLIDTFRLAIRAYNLQRYTLDVLSKQINANVRKCQTTSYKWRGKSGDKVVEVAESVEEMQQHHAATDVLVTYELLQDACNRLNISIKDFGEKYQEYSIPKCCLSEADGLLQGGATNEQLEKLAELAPYLMNVNFPDRGLCFKDMTADRIQQVINYLSSRNWFPNQRVILICRGFKLLALSGRSCVAKKNADGKQKDLTPSLKFAAEGLEKRKAGSSDSCESPTKVAKASTVVSEELEEVEIIPESLNLSTEDWNVIDNQEDGALNKDSQVFPMVVTECKQKKMNKEKDCLSQDF